MFLNELNWIKKGNRKTRLNLSPYSDMALGSRYLPSGTTLRWLSQKALKA